MFVSIIAVRGMLAELRKNGSSASALLADTTINDSILADMRSVIASEELDVLVARAIRLSNDPGLGLTVGMNAPESTFQIVAHLALAAPTMGDAFGLLERYSPLLIDSLRVSMTRVGRVATFAFGFHHAVNPLTLRYGAECFMATVVRFARHFAANGLVREVRFEHPEPPYAMRYHEFFEAPVRFGQRDNALVFDAEILDRRQPHADLAMAEVLRTAAEQLLSSGGPRVSLADRLRIMLRRERDLCSVDTERLARELGVSQRALRRRLSADGLSVSQLLEEARCSVACEALQRPGGSIKDVADRLGYSEPSAFHRAFKRWTGQTPAAYVRTLTGDSDLLGHPALLTA